MAVREDVVINWAVSPRIIEVKADSTSISIQDIVDTCRTLESELDSLDDKHLIDAAGKEYLNPEESVGITLTLQNAKVKFEARSPPDYIPCIVSGGNLVAVDINGDPMSPIEPSAYTQVTIAQSTSASIVEGEAGGMTEEEHDHLMQDVALESTLSGVSGKSSHIKKTVGEIKDQVNIIHEIEAGGWKIMDNQCIVYGPDNKTEIARFNLLDKDGKPTEINPNEMKRV